MLPVSIDDALATTLTDKIFERLTGTSFDTVEADFRLPRDDPCDTAR